MSTSYRLYAQIGLLVIVLVLAWLGNFITKKIILRVVRRLIKKSRTQWDDILVERRVFTLLSHLTPAIIILLFPPFVFLDTLGIGRFMQVAAEIYLLIVGILVINAFLSSVMDIYRTFEVAG